MMFDVVFLEIGSEKAFDATRAFPPSLFFSFFLARIGVSKGDVAKPSPSSCRVTLLPFDALTCSTTSRAPAARLLTPQLPPFTASITLLLHSESH